MYLTLLVIHGWYGLRRNPAITSWYGSLSHYLQGFVHPSCGCLGFLNPQQYWVIGMSTLLPNQSLGIIPGFGRIPILADPMGSMKRGCLRVQHIPENEILSKVKPPGSLHSKNHTSLGIPKLNLPCKPLEFWGSFLGVLIQTIPKL